MSRREDNHNQPTLANRSKAKSEKAAEFLDQSLIEDPAKSQADEPAAA